MYLKTLKDVTYFRLNNEINIPVDGQIPLHKDDEALLAFFVENVKPNLKAVASFAEKIDFLIANDYIETAFIKKYSIDFITSLSDWLYAQEFQFKSFRSEEH